MFYCPLLGELLHEFLIFSLFIFSTFEQSYSLRSGIFFNGNFHSWYTGIPNWLLKRIKLHIPECRFKGYWKHKSIVAENPLIASLWIYSCSQTKAHSVKLEAQNGSQGTTVAALCSHLIKLGSMQLRCAVQTFEEPVWGRILLLLLKYLVSRNGMHLNSLEWFPQSCPHLLSSFTFLIQHEKQDRWKQNGGCLLWIYLNHSISLKGQFS